MGGGYWVWWVREIISPFLQMNMVLLTLLSHDLQLVLEWFAAECETDGNKTTSESEVTVFTWIRPECPPGGRVCYLGVLFMSQWRVERETDTWIDVESAVIQTVCCGEQRAEHESEAADLLVDLRSNFHLWHSGSDGKNEIADTSRLN